MPPGGSNTLGRLVARQVNTLMEDLNTFEPRGNKALVRVDFNVPLKKEAAQSSSGYLSADDITDDARIQAAVPTIRLLLAKGFQVVLVAHLGRPKNGFASELSLQPVAQRLSQTLDVPVKLLPLPGAQMNAEGDFFAQLSKGEVGLVENIRFDPRETSKDAAERITLARELTKGADLFVSDGFGVVHREQASVTDAARLVPSVPGLLVAKEMAAFDKVLQEPAKPYVVILGGAKVSDKIPVIENLLKSADTLLIGGAMAFTFLKAQGFEVGKSLVEDDFLSRARDLLELAKDQGVSVFLPSDVVVADSLSDPTSVKHVPVGQIPSDAIGLDIGPATVEVFADQIRVANTVVWNGPMGVFEQPAFAKGTFGVAQAVADCKGFTVIGGGDTAAAVHAAGLPDSRFSHVSTGGGASLELLEGKELPGLKVLSEAVK